MIAAAAKRGHGLNDEFVPQPRIKKKPVAADEDAPPPEEPAEET